MIGKFIPLDEDNEEIYAYIRDDSTISKRYLVILNFGRGSGRGVESTFAVPDSVDVAHAKLLISNGDESEGSGIQGKQVKLSPWEGRIYAL